MGLARICFASAILISCGGGKDGPAVDAFTSSCGNPGDLGNDLGIGKFCGTISDCSTTTAAPLCSSLGDPTTHFCTKTCQSSGSATQCGTGAQCECNAGNQCGCTPTSCLAP